MSPAEKPQKPSPKAPALKGKPDQETLDFIQAIDNYKRENERAFPSWGEVLWVLKSLGYTRESDHQRKAG